MMGKASMAVLIGVLALTVSACGDDRPAQKTAEAGSTKPSGPVSYSTVADLVDAAIDAGYDCAQWVQDDAVTLAAESGHCSDADVFATFASEGDLQQQLETDRSMDDLLKESGIEPDPTLVGPNWSISGPDAPALADALGGTVSR